MRDITRHGLIMQKEQSGRSQQCFTVDSQTSMSSVHAVAKRHLEIAIQTGVREWCMYANDGNVGFRVTTVFASSMDNSLGSSAHVALKFVGKS